MIKLFPHLIHVHNMDKQGEENNSIKINKYWMESH
jgi:hypothetical protein